VLRHRGIATWLGSLAITVALFGCSGGDEPATEQPFSTAEARRIVSVRPVTPEWPPWPQNATANDAADGSELSNKWTDDDKLANLVVQVWGSANKARDWMPEFNAFSRKWGAVTSPPV
jgi:hypothetical protein